MNIIAIGTIAILIGTIVIVIIVVRCFCKNKYGFQEGRKEGRGVLPSVVVGRPIDLIDLI